MNSRTKAVIPWISLVIVGLTISTLLDHVVHDDLYMFGLVFSFEWANKYWTYFSLSFVVLILVSVTAYHLGGGRDKRLMGIRRYLGAF